MTDFVDLPNQHPELQATDSDTLRDMAEQGKTDLFFFGRGIMRYKDMTERAHMALCVFFDSNPAQYKLGMMPRDHFKSSAITIAGNTQKAVRNPEERILICNEASTNAERFLRAIRQHCETNKVFRTLYGKVLPKDTRRVRWNDSELEFHRNGVYPEPTFDTIGMTGAMTSRHYSHMCFDDVISEEATKSQKVMEDTKNRLSALTALLTNPNTDTVWFIGTRWALQDVYAHRMKIMGHMLAQFIRGAIEDGEPIFPERFSLETLALMRADMGEYKFSCLMMNNPRDESTQDFNTRDLRFWRWADAKQEVIAMLDVNGDVQRLVPVAALDITAAVDLAPAERITSDRNAVTVVGVTPWNEAIVLSAWGKRCTPIGLIDHIFEVKQRWNPRVFGIEGVAYQKAFKYFLKQEAERREVYLRIQELTATGKKEHRIRGLQPLAAVGRLFLDPQQMILRDEMAQFPLGDHDDVLDSLSMHLQLFRGQMTLDAIEKAKERREQIMRSINGYSIRNDPGVLVLPSGAIVGVNTPADLSDRDFDDEPRYQNWEEVEVA